MELTSEQQSVAEIRDGNHVAAAGPGSGKTRTLVERTRSMLQAGVAAATILLVTFTKAAATEIKERLADVPGGDAVEIRTWHSWGYGVIREAGLVRSVTTHSTSILRGIWIDQKLPEVEPSDNTEGFSPEVLNRAIQKAKLDGHFAPGPSHWPQRWREVYAEYERRMTTNQTADFGDMLLRSEHLLRTDYGYLEQVRSRYSHLMVDECQDNNQLQWRLVGLLAPGMESTVVVGDSRQSIFGFAGAQPQQLVEFSREAAVHSITINWRSTKQIVAACNRLMALADQSRLVGEAFRAPDDGPEGPEPQAHGAMTPTHQGELVAQAIQAQLAAGLAPSQIACLYRTRRCSMQLSRALLRAGIPHVIRGGQSFFQLRHVKIVLGYLRVAAGMDDRKGSAIKLTFNTPKRYLGAKSLGLAAGASAVWPSVEDICPQPRAERSWRQYLAAVDAVLNAADPEEAIRVVLATLSGGRGEPHTLAQELAGKIGDEEGDGSVEEDFETLLDLAREYQDVETFLHEVDRLSGVASVDPNRQEMPPEAVTLMTIHRSKGLEYTAVHLCSASMGMLPHARALTEGGPEGLEEERRLAFVAMSRARGYLDCWYYDHDERGMEAGPSCFLASAGIK